MFRGILMQTGSWFKIPILSIIIQAIIFAFSHRYNSLRFFEMLVNGFMWGFFTLKTNGLEWAVPYILRIIQCSFIHYVWAFNFNFISAIV